MRRLGLTVVRALVLVVALGAQAGAAIDASGPWYVVDDLIGAPCLMNFDTAAGLTITGPCDPILAGLTAVGTVDAQSGTFEAVGSTTGFCSEIRISGTIAAAGDAFSASLLCADFGLTIGLSGFRCGNGRMDAAEQCDDGGRADGDCCSSSCELAPDGASCDDGESCTAADRCEAGACVTSEQPDGAACDDGNACTQGETCSAGHCQGSLPVTCGDVCASCDPLAGCVFEPRWGECELQFGAVATAIVKDGPDPSRDALSLSLSGRTSLDIADLGDPRASTRYDVCVYDGAGALLARGAAAPGGLCAGKPCWTGLTDGYRYQSTRADGLRSLVLRVGPAGRLSIKAKGRGGGIEAGPLPAEGQWPSVQVSASDGACFVVPFSGWLRNGPAVAEARKKKF